MCLTLLFLTEMHWPKLGQTLQLKKKNYLFDKEAYYKLLLLLLFYLVTQLPQHKAQWVGVTSPSRCHVITFTYNVNVITWQPPPI